MGSCGQDVSLEIYSVRCMSSDFFVERWTVSSIHQDLCRKIDSVQCSTGSFFEDVQ